MKQVRRIAYVLGVICLVAAETILVLLLWGLGQRPSVEWSVIVSQSVAIVLVLIAVLMILRNERRVLPVRLSTLVFAYFTLAVSLAAGSWAWGAVINAGSAYHSLAIGKYVIGPGDIPPHRVDLTLWSLEMTVVTALTVLALRQARRHLRKHC